MKHIHAWYDNETRTPWVVLVGDYSAELFVFSHEASVWVSLGLLVAASKYTILSRVWGKFLVPNQQERKFFQHVMFEAIEEAPDIPWSRIGPEHEGRMDLQMRKVLTDREDSCPDVRTACAALNIDPVRGSCEDPDSNGDWYAA